jgi:hypothetical protein
MGPALYGLSGDCGCGSSHEKLPSAPLSGGCGCGGSRSALGTTPLTNYLCSETQVAKSLTKEGNEAALIIGIGAGAAGGLLGSVIKAPLLGLVAGTLLGYVIYQTQRMPDA